MRNHHQTKHTESGTLSTIGRAFAREVLESWDWVKSQPIGSWWGHHGVRPSEDDIVDGDASVNEMLSDVPSVSRASSNSWFPVSRVAPTTDTGGV